MGLVSDAAAMARGRAGAIFLTAALALLPAYFLAGGIVFLAAAQASAQAEGGSTQADAAAARGRELPPDAPAEARRDVLREASGPAAPRLPPVSLALAAGILVASLVMMGAMFLAQAALLQVAAGASRPSAAWAAVAARFPALSGTAAAALALIALGLVACALSLAGAVEVADGISGFPALQRSWELIKRAWPQQLALILGTAALVVVLTQGLGRLLTDGAILAHGLLDAAVAAAVLPLPVFGSAVLYLRERSAAEGKPVDELRQYIRRTSEPG